MIEKNIHHVWPGSDPFRYPEWRLSWMKLNPDWTFCFWRPDNLPRGILETTKKIVENETISYVVKSDVLRLDVVRLLGGIYVDTDMEALKPMDDLRQYSSFCGTYFDVPCNALFGAEAGNDIVTQAAIAAGNNVLKDPEYACSSYDGVFDTCGGRALHGYFNKMEKIFGDNVFYRRGVNAYSTHHWTSNEPGGWTRLLRDAGKM